jgi:hypothetical protein
MDLSLDHPGINLPSGQDVADLHHQPVMGGDEAVVDAGMAGDSSEYFILTNIFGQIKENPHRRPPISHRIPEYLATLVPLHLMVFPGIFPGKCYIKKLGYPGNR